MHSTESVDTVDFPSWDELSDLEQAQATFWDMYKDAYGVRPRGVDTSGWTLETFRKEFDYLGQIIEREDIARKAAEGEAVEAFERRVAELMTMGARDRDMALRWIHEAEETNGDDSYLAWTLGLPYRYFSKQSQSV
jgi:hypothetical protein